MPIRIPLTSTKGLFYAAGAAADNGLLAPEPAASIRTSEAPAMLLGCWPRRSEVAALTTSRVE
jgi:hypothetical protein